MKQIFLLALFVVSITSYTTQPQHYTYTTPTPMPVQHPTPMPAPQPSPYGTQGVGAYLPYLSPVQTPAVTATSTTTSSVVFTRICKAICGMHIPENITCGLNNQIYMNDCQAACDRIGTDQTRLMFNKKCCCVPGSEYIDSAWARGTDVGPVNSTLVSNDPSIVSSSFCASVLPSETPTVLTGKINVFAIPPCLRTCLGINALSDLKFVDTSRTYVAECDDGI